MKDSIFHVPIANDFIDLEQLVRISSISFSDFAGTVGLELTYMFRKDRESIFIRATELFAPDEMKKYEGYRLADVMNHTPSNEKGRQFEQDAVKAFDEKVRTPIYDAWKTYRESKSK